MTQPPNNRESSIEAFLHKRIQLVGGHTIKLAPTVKGLPDRLVIAPGGNMYLVEMKAPGGRLSPMQQFQHAKLQKLGVEVVVLTSYSSVVQWIKHLPVYRNVDDD